jgi:hypothetical protein
MVVTRGAFRTVGAADDSDSIVPCQLPVRVHELDGRISAEARSRPSLVMLRQKFRVSEQQLFSVGGVVGAKVGFWFW